MSQTEVSVGSTNRKELKKENKNAHRCAILYTRDGDLETRVDFVETWRDGD